MLVAVRRTGNEPPEQWPRGAVEQSTLDLIVRGLLGPVGALSCFVLLVEVTGAPPAGGVALLMGLLMGYALGALLGTAIAVRREERFGAPLFTERGSVFDLGAVRTVAHRPPAGGA